MRMLSCPIMTASGGCHWKKYLRHQVHPTHSPNFVRPSPKQEIILSFTTPNQWQMKTRSLSLKISPSIGVVSAECLILDNSQCIMTLAHGAGAGINQSFMVRKQIKDLEFTGGT